MTIAAINAATIREQLQRALDRIRNLEDRNRRQAETIQRLNREIMDLKRRLRKASE